MLASPSAIQARILTLAQDLRFTTHVINNLLYVSSQRELLYVTDSTTYGNRTATSHSFEHLSCFFPGLLALGAHLLPLNNLESIGINFTQLGDNFPPKPRQGYEALAEFDLADLHLWAAEGIAQMCYLSYADQPSGLGPDTVTMRIGKSGEIRWMDAMQKWKESGQLGSPPGVGDKEPWVGNPKARTVRQKQIDAITRDYTIKNTAYYLRPEVWLMLPPGDDAKIIFCRPSSHFTSCGGRPGTSNGGTEAGVSSRLLSASQRRRQDIPVWIKFILRIPSYMIQCQG